jgi:hypothetical protein
VTVATDPDPYFAFPKLYGAPAYARPPKVVEEETERPLNPDDLPIAAAMTDDERAVAEAIEAERAAAASATAGARPAGGPSGSAASRAAKATSVASSPVRPGPAHGGGRAAAARRRRLDLRAIVDLLGPRDR